MDFSGRRLAARQQAAGRALVRFGDIPLDWTDFRLTLRQTADILRRFDALEPADYDGHRRARARRQRARADRARVVQRDVRRRGGDRRAPRAAPAGLDQVLVLALRPFLARCAEVLTQRVDLSAWRHGALPVLRMGTGFAVITPSGDRRLICGRCVGAVGRLRPSRARSARTTTARAITSFATRDGRYRVYGCDVCHRYLKAYDARNAARPVMVAVDTIATLPLDAAAMQRGYA